MIRKRNNKLKSEPKSKKKKKKKNFHLHGFTVKHDHFENYIRVIEKNLEI